MGFDKAYFDPRFTLFYASVENTINYSHHKLQFNEQLHCYYYYMEKSDTSGAEQALHFSHKSLESGVTAVQGTDCARSCFASFFLAMYQCMNRKMKWVVVDRWWWCPCHALLSTQVRWHFINNAISGCKQSRVAYPTSLYTSHVLSLFQMASPRIRLLLLFFG